MRCKQCKNCKEVKLILSAENEKLLQELIEHCLEWLNNNICIWHTNKHSKIFTYLNDKQFHLIIIDSNISEWLDIYNKIRNMQQYYNIPILFLLNDLKLQEDLKKLLIKKSKCYFITKPFLPYEFAQLTFNILSNEKNNFDNNFLLD